MKTYQPHCSSLGGISANIVAMAAYIVALVLGTPGFIVVLVLFFVERNSGLVRFHTMQACVFWALRSIALSVLSIVVGTFSNGLFSLFGLFGRVAFFDWSGGIVSGLLTAAIWIVYLIGTLLGAINAYRWGEWQIPVVGGIAMNFASRATKPAYTGDGPVPPGCEQGTGSRRNPAPGSPPPAGNQPPPSAEHQAPPPPPPPPPASPPPVANQPSPAASQPPPPASPPPAASQPSPAASQPSPAASQPPPAAPPTPAVSQQPPVVSQPSPAASQPASAAPRAPAPPPYIPPPQKSKSAPQAAPQEETQPPPPQSSPHGAPPPPPPRSTGGPDLIPPPGSPYASTPPEDEQ